MPILHFDFETRSELNLPKVGAAQYAAHPSTEVMSVAFALDDEEPILLDEYEILYPDAGLNKGVDQLYNIASDPTVLMGAHNSFFEECIWKYVMVKRLGYPPISQNRWRCTAAKAASFALPRKLGKLGGALKLPVQKDMTGNAAMLVLSRPRRVSEVNKDRFWTPETAPEKFKLLYSYNVDDVRSERYADQLLPDLSDEEQEIWQMNQEMNHRGLKLDREAILKAVEFLRQENKRLKQLFLEATDGECYSPLQPKFLTYLQAHGLKIRDRQGKTLDKILEADESLPYISDELNNVITLARQLYKTSTAKFTKMLTMMSDDDDRLRGYLIYCGAERTGRWSSVGVQLQNTMRLPKGFDLEATIADLKALSYEQFRRKYPNLIETIAVCVRGMIIASEGHELFVSDFSGIESRILAWVAGQKDLLDLFWDLDFGLTDIDNYCQSAGEILNRLVTKADDFARQMGKVAELSLGYNGGIAAFAQMAPSYKLDLEELFELVWPTATEDEKQKAWKAYKQYKKKADDPISAKAGCAVDVIKQRYRKKRTAIVELWAKMEEAAIECVRTGEETCAVEGKVYFSISGKGSRQFLNMHLPSGRQLHYHRPAIAHRKTPWGAMKEYITYMGQGKNHQYVRLSTYGGKLTENWVQAVARDLMAGAFRRVRRAGFKPLLLVHDEAVSEAKLHRYTLEEYNKLMVQKEAWAKGLPLEVAGTTGLRYGIKE